MRSALFLHDDESLINRITITVHDDNAEYYFAKTIDAAIDILDTHEVALFIMPYNFDVLSGNEMIEIVLDHNPKAQIIVLFKDKDLSDVVRSHNVYHLCQLICEDFFKVEDLPAVLDMGFRIYNREEDLKSFELNFRQKEDTYKKAFVKMSSLLNDRTLSYGYIKDLLTETVRFSNNDTADYIDNLFKEYIQLFLLKDYESEEYFRTLSENYSNSSECKYLKIENNCTQNISNNILFGIYTATSFIYDFYKKYRAKIELNEQNGNILLNIVFEAEPVKVLSSNYDSLPVILEHILAILSDKILYATKDKIVQYRLMYKKNQNET